MHFDDFAFENLFVSDEDLLKDVMVKKPLVNFFLIERYTLNSVSVVKLYSSSFYCCRVLTFYFNLDSTAMRGLLTKLSVGVSCPQEQISCTTL